MKSIKSSRPLSRILVICCVSSALGPGDQHLGAHAGWVLRTAETLVQNISVFTRIDCPIFYVRDLNEAITFYTDLIGFELIERVNEYAEMRLGGTKLAINSGEHGDKTPGQQTLILQSDSIHSDHRRIEAAVGVVESLDDRGYGLTFIFVDPSGNKLEVIEKQ